MIRLSSLLPRGRKMFWLAILVPVGLVGLFMLASFFKIDLKVDLAAILWALAVLGGLAIVYVGVRYLAQPKQTCSIGFSVKLVQPTVPLIGRYCFRLEVFYELEQKGERSRIDQGTIEMRFRKKDHPEMLAWCCAQITEQMTKHAEMAAERYPTARILLPPQPTPGVLVQEVGSKEWSDAQATASGSEA
jgi:hypothetical protein